MKILKIKITNGGNCTTCCRKPNFDRGKNDNLFIYYTDEEPDDIKRTILEIKHKYIN